MRYRSITVIIALLVFSVRILYANYTYSDEIYYINLARMLLEGDVLYKFPHDSFAHPPLQIVEISVLFSAFGLSPSSAKILPILSSILCSFFVMFLVEKMFGEREGIISFFVFLFMPSTLSFSSVAYGIYPAIMLSILSLYMSRRQKYFPSAIIFSIAFLFRYLSLIMLIPIIFFSDNKRRLAKYMILTFSMISLFLISNPNLLAHSVFSHFFTKMNIIKNSINEYFMMNMVFVSISILYVVSTRRNLFIALYPIFADLLLLFLGAPYFHYFLFTAPIYAIVFSILLTRTEDKFASFGLIILILLPVYINFQTISFYNLPNQGLNYIGSLIINDSISGEFTHINYLSLTKNLEVKPQIYDLSMQKLLFDNSSLYLFESDNPQYFIDVNDELSAYPFFKSLLDGSYRREYSYDDGYQNIVIHKLK